jgi:hypothetical protein
MPKEHKQQDDMDKIFDRVGLHRQTLASWRFEGRGPAYYKIGRKVVYYEEDLREFLRQNRVEPAAAA